MKTATKLINTAGALVLPLVVAGSAYAGLFLGAEAGPGSASAAGISVEVELPGAAVAADTRGCASDQSACPVLFLSPGDPWGQA
ncbi:hypothetical protein ACWFMI_00920 [Nocardiopsis terrae]